MTLSEYKNGEIVLTPLQEREFICAVKISVYRQLNKKGLLSDEQLSRLIIMQNQSS